MTVEFDPFSRDFFDDPYATYARLRDEAPCYHSERYDFYALSRYEDVVAAHRDHDTFISSRGLTYEQLSDPDADVAGSLIMMDPPEHTRYRKLVSRAFTPRAMASWEDLVREIVVGYLEPLVGEPSFDLVGEFAGPFPVEVISAILGVPEGDRQQIRHWTDTMLRREEGEATGGAAAQGAGIAQTMYFLELVAEKRRCPGDDMLSALVAAEVETGDGGTASLDDIEIAAFGTLLGAAGSETVTKLVGNAAVLFHRNPDQWRLVKEDPELHADAVEEILRYWPPSQYQGRCSAFESEWHGVTVPSGKPVFLLTGAATHDERAYEDPDRFDVRREQALAIGLGHGVHACLGAALARLESRVAIGEMAARLPDFAVDEAGCERVQMSNVAGYSKVPVHTGH